MIPYRIGRYSLRLNDWNLAELLFIRLNIVASKVGMFLHLRLKDWLDIGDAEWLTQELLDYYSVMIDRGLNWMIDDLHTQGKCCLTRRVIIHCEKESCLRDERTFRKS